MFCFCQIAGDSWYLWWFKSYFVYPKNKKSKCDIGKNNDSDIMCNWAVSMKMNIETKGRFKGFREINKKNTIIFQHITQKRLLYYILNSVASLKYLNIKRNILNSRVHMDQSKTYLNIKVHNSKTPHHVISLT